MDNHQRMSKIKSKGSKMEILFGKALWSNGYRYRKHYKKLEGVPDFVIVCKKIAIFCDSSFWHGYANMSTKIHNFKSNKDYWYNRIKRNLERDRQVNKKLQLEGWKVVRFWDFEIFQDVNACIARISKIVNS